MDLSKGNLLDACKSVITPTVMQQASQMLGQSADKTRSGFAAAIPTMLSGIVQKGSTESGARGLMDMIQSGGFDKVTDPQNLLQAAARDPTGPANRGILNSIFGENLAGVENLIAQKSGITTAGSGSLLGMLAPVVMGVLGMQSRGMGASGLMSLLMQQKSSIMGAAPEGVKNLFHFQGKTIGTRPVPRDSDYEAGKTPHPEGQRKSNWVAPTLIALAVLGGLYWFGKNRSMQTQNDNRSPTTAETAQVDTPARTLDSFDSNQVRELQNALNKQGYSIPEDGVMGESTRDALIDFQRKNGLADAGEGVMTPKTAEQLNLSSEFMLAH